MSKKRLIDANAFQLEPDPFGGANGVLCLGRSNGKMMATTLLMLRKMVDNAPTVDAVEVVHGRWEKAEYNGFLRCDQCKDVYINEEWLEDGKWNYCPNCGAKMDGDENV